MDSRLFTPPVAPEVRWRQFEERVLGEFQGFFDAESPIVGARAPGRLDVMGELPTTQEASYWRCLYRRLRMWRGSGAMTASSEF